MSASGAPGLSIETVKQRNKIALVALPGGGVTREYFDLGKANGFNHSFAQRMTGFGFHLITLDHPGTGSNGLDSNHSFLKPRDSARYIHDALVKFRADPDIKDLTFVGVGHSMGGMTTTLIQGAFQPFAAICLFGSSAGGLDWGLSDHEKEYIDQTDKIDADIEKLTLAKFGMAFTPPSPGPSATSEIFAGATPEATALLSNVGAALYCAGGMMSMIRGSFRREVEAIKVPIFFAFGDRDIGIAPLTVPADYVNASDIRLVVLPETGHNSFAFPSLASATEKLAHWLDGVTG